MTRRLCTLADIPDPGSKSLGDDSTDALFAVRQGDEVRVYRNRCPHAGMPLNWMPDRFLDRDKERILCTVHGARFRIEDGECVSGPCPGEHLEAVPATVQDGVVWIG